MKSRLIINQSFLSEIIDSVVSAPTASTTLPCTNLFNGMRHKYASIIPAGNAATITVTLKSAISISSVAIGGFNLSETATAKCQVKDGSGTTVYDSNTGNVYSDASQYTLPWYSRTKAWFFSLVSAKTIIITINDTVTPYTLSHFVFGVDYSASLNPDWGMSWDWVDMVILQRTQGGSLLANPSYGHRKVQLSWTNLPSSDYNNLGTLIQTQGQSLLISVFPGDNSKREADMQMICRLVSTEGINLDGYNLNSMRSFVFEEI